MYCTEQNIIDRLSLAGLMYLLDDDADESYESADSDIVAEAINDASDEIDVYVARWFENPRTTLSGNSWLKGRCVDIACERLCERKGQNVPASLLSAVGRTREWLAAVATGDLRIPQAVYPTDGTNIEDLREFGLPRVSNPRVR